MRAASRTVGPLSALVLWAIRGYQRWLSPLKGFRCAHAALHGGSGCSGFVMEAIGAHGLIKALGPIRKRFRDCRVADEAIKSGRPDDPGGGRMRPEIPEEYRHLPRTPPAPPGITSCAASAERNRMACQSCNMGAIGGGGIGAGD